MNNPKSRARRYSLTAVSPTFIESGAELINGRDFVKSGEEIFILDRTALTEYAALRPELYSSFITCDCRYGFFMQKHDINPADFALRKLSSGLTIEKFKPFYFNSATSKPQIPASTIKGSLRTALLWAIAHEEGKVKEGYFLSQEGKRAIENLIAASDCAKASEATAAYTKSSRASSGRGCGRFSGERSSEPPNISANRLEGTLFTGFRRRPGDPETVGARWEAANADLMRVFSLGDANSYISDENPNTSIYEARVLSLLGGGRGNRGYVWKSENDDTDDTTTAGGKQRQSGQNLFEMVEAMLPGAKMELTLKIDEELLLDSEKGAALGLYRSPKSDVIRDWHLETLLFASEMANEEMKFFASLNLAEAAYFYQDLVNAINEADDATTTYLRLGKFVGWNSISASFLRGENLNALRAAHPALRGRDRMPFPKTRKMLFEDGKTPYPAGWVKLELIQD